jgi:hypothetical protein
MPLYRERFLLRFLGTIGVEVVISTVSLSTNAVCDCAGILGIQVSIALPNKIL